MSYVLSTVEADRLASLALKAAIETGRKSRGARTDMQSLAAFANAISQFAGIESDAANGTYRLDPSSSEMLSRAVTAATRKSVSNMDNLNQELTEIISNFSNNPDPTISWSDLKKFCLEVHKLILGGRCDAGLHERGVFDYDHSFSG